MQQAYQAAGTARRGGPVALPRAALAGQHIGIVRAIARDYIRGLPPSVELDDLISAGNEALVRAAARWRPHHHSGAAFATFARYAVRGAMISAVRRAARTSPAGSSGGLRLIAPGDVEAKLSRAKIRRELDRAIDTLPSHAARLMRALLAADAPRISEAARRAGIPAARAYRIRQDAFEALRERLGRLCE